MFFVLNDAEWFKGFRVQGSIPSVHVNVDRFQNGEVSVHLSEDVANKDIILLKRFSSNIHEDIFELLQCVDVINRMRAKTVTLLLPYYPYARQDHNTHNASKGALLLAKTLVHLGVDKIVTMDMHAPEQLRDFPLKIVNLTTECFWGEHLRFLGCEGNKTQIIAADKSAMPRAQQMASILKCCFGYVDKRRDASGEVQIKEISGFNPEKQTFLVDDLIDTGRTIIAAAQSLRQLSSLPITACVTHCHLSKTLLSALRIEGITRLITTDTIKKEFPLIQTSQINFTLLNACTMLWNGFVGNRSC